MGISPIDQHIQKFKEGNSRAFAAIYEELSPLLLLYARHLTKDITMAEDIVQEAFVQLFRKREQLDLRYGAYSIRRYMMVLIRHQALRALERQGRLEAKKREMQFVFPLMQEPEVFRQEVKAAVYQKIRQCIQALPKTEQRVFELLYMEEKSPEEVSAILHITKRSVENAKSKVLAVLRESELHLAVLLVVCLTHYGNFPSTP